MRYADGGGLTARGRAARERVRLQATELFEQQLPTGEIAARLRVSPKSVRAWRRAWTAGGSPALASRGPGGAVCKLSDAQLDRLADELDRGPAAQEWADWTSDQRRDPGPGHGADPPPVRSRLHPARGVLSAAPDRLDPAGPGPARGRA